MRVYKTREFARFAKRERIADAALCEAVSRLERGLIDAELGSSLVKQRVARLGQGRSGGFRTLIVYRAAARAVFVYGFAKSERGNIGESELVFWRKVAAVFLGLDAVKMQEAVALEEIEEVICHDKAQSN